jgi:hypothetical protein
MFRENTTRKLSNTNKNTDVTPGHRGDRLKNNLYWKKNRYLASYSLGEKLMFKESPPSIMVTRNPNRSTEILWHVTGYAKGKMLSPLKHPP